MTYFDNGFARLYQADARHLPIPDSSVDCVVTSPPYWGLRDYGLGEWIGGNADCDHTISMPLKWNDPKRGTNYTRPEVAHRGGDARKCFLCDAQRVDSGIGLEPTPEEYCANMVAVFREVWRVLKPTGTVWLNLGDTYSAQRWTKKGMDRTEAQPMNNMRDSWRSIAPTKNSGLADKNLVGIPWRVAFALQADGWYLRSDIIWSKPNPMPESVQDRPTKAHEYIFLLTKNARYYYDADAIREPMSEATKERDKHGFSGAFKGQMRGSPNESRWQDGRPIDTPTFYSAQGRNKRSVWEITTQPYPEAHFATFPEKLVEPCILAGTSEKGNCAECGKPWERIVEASGGTIGEGWHDHTDDLARGMRDNSSGKSTDGTYKREHKGWQPTCSCNAEVVPATVLDPFAGSGTTLAVAQRLGRKSIGTDLSEEYLKLASKRLGAIAMPMILF
jgi:DNA modification methylase